MGGSFVDEANPRDLAARSGSGGGGVSGGGGGSNDGEEEAEAGASASASSAAGAASAPARPPASTSRSAANTNSTAGPSGTTTRGSRSNSTSSRGGNGGGSEGGSRRTRRNRWTNEEEEVSDDDNIPVEFRDFLMDQIARQMFEQFGPNGGGGGPPMPFPFPFGAGPPPFGPPYYDDDDDESDYDDDNDDDDSMPPLETRDGRIQRGGDDDDDDDDDGSMPSLEDIVVPASSRTRARNTGAGGEADPRDLSEVESLEDDDEWTEDDSQTTVPIPLYGAEESDASSDASMPRLEPIATDDGDDEDIDDLNLRMAIQMSLQEHKAAAANRSDDDDDDDDDSMPGLEPFGGGAGSKKAASAKDRRCDDDDTDEDMPGLEPLPPVTVANPAPTVSRTGAAGAGSTASGGRQAKGVRRQRGTIGASSVRPPSPAGGEHGRKKKGNKGASATASGLWLMAAGATSAGEDTSVEKPLWHIGGSGAINQAGCVSASAKLIPDTRGGALIQSPQDSSAASRWSLERITRGQKTPSSFHMVNSETQVVVDYKAGVWALSPSKDGEVMVLSSLRKPKSRSSGRSTIRTFPKSSTLVGGDSKGSMFVHVPLPNTSLDDVGVWRVDSKTESELVAFPPEDTDKCIVDGLGQVFCLTLGNKNRKRKLYCLSEGSRPDESTVAGTAIDPLFFVRQPLLICAAKNGGVFLHCPGEGKFSSWSLKHIARDGSTLTCTDLGECPTSARIISDGGSGVWIIRKNRTKGANPSLSHADVSSGGKVEVVCEELPFMPDGMDLVSSN